VQRRRAVHPHATALDNVIVVATGETAMPTFRILIVGCVFAVVVAAPIVVAAEKIDSAPPNETVQFGALPPQPPAPAHHVLVPDEVTITKGGTVTFEVNGGGHSIAIYPVSRDTVRADIEAALCSGGPGAPACPSPAPGTLIPPENFSALATQIRDGKGDLIIDIPADTTNRVTDPTDRLVLGGGPVFFTGRPAAGLPNVPAPVVQYRFEKTGRFLVICTNRTHFLNDWMFGFIEVVGGDAD
jgi:hypothetical protein